MGQDWKASGDLPPPDELVRVTTALFMMLDAEGANAAQQIYILANALACCAVAAGGDEPRARAEAAVAARTLFETRIHAALAAAYR